jgi:hypothetical protein
LATNPEDQEINPSAIEKVVRAIQTPLKGKRSRTGFLLAFAGLLAALAPFPWGSFACAALILVALDRD